ncbi:MAG: hypothetical protein ACPH9N_07165 [Alteromonas sp.]
MVLLSLDGTVEQATLNDVKQVDRIVSEDLISETLQIGGAASVVLINK